MDDLEKYATAFRDKKHKNPLWHTCVGVVSVHCSSILLVNKEFNLWGDTSREFFKDVCIYEYVGNEKLETTLNRCSDTIYDTSSKLFKYHADYQQLAGSIFEKRSQCCNLVHSEDTDTYLGWLVTPKNTIGISGVTDDYGLMDVGKQIREKLKSQVCVMDAGKKLFHLF